MLKGFSAVTSINVSVGIQSNTTCCSFSNGVYYTLSDIFRPFYNGHLQASILGGVVNTTVISNVQDIVSCQNCCILPYIGRCCSK
jgi:hypothetical protein